MIAVETEGIISVPRGSGTYVISKPSRLGMVLEEDVDVFELLQARRTMESEACALAAPRICFEYGSAPIHNHFPESKEALLPEPTSLAMRRSASLRSCFPTSFCASRILKTQAKRKGRQSDPKVIKERMPERPALSITENSE